MINNRKIKQRLRDGNRLNGCWILMYNQVAAEIMSRCGYDVMMVDLEHGPGTWADAQAVFQVLGASACSPMLRVPSAEPAIIKKALDIGPEGIMVPDVRNADSAREVVLACRYGPDGIRGAAPWILRASDWGEDISEYYRFMEEEFLLMVQVENAEAVENIDSIVAVEGIDMVFIGPADLSASLGALGEFESDAFSEAFGRIEQATIAAGKMLGTIPFPGWSAEKLYASGHRLVLSGMDSMLLKQTAKEDVDNMRKAAR